MYALPSKRRADVIKRITFIHYILMSFRRNIGRKKLMFQRNAKVTLFF